MQFPVKRFSRDYIMPERFFQNDMTEWKPFWRFFQQAGSCKMGDDCSLKGSRSSQVKYMIGGIGAVRNFQRVDFLFQAIKILRVIISKLPVPNMFKKFVKLATFRAGKVF